MSKRTSFLRFSQKFTGGSDSRLDSVVNAVTSLENNASAASAASITSKYLRSSSNCRGPGNGISIGGSFDAYVTVDN